MRYFTFILKSSILLLVVLWFSYFPGNMDVTWAGYRIKMSLALAAGSTVILVYILLFIQKYIHRFFSYVRHRKERRQLKDYKRLESLTVEALACLSFQNNDSFNQVIQTVGRLLPESLLYKYLQYRRAMSDDDEKALVDLLKTTEINTPLSFLLTKQQVHRAIGQDNYALALSLCQSVLAHRVEPWFLKAAIFVNIKLNDFEKALEWVQVGMDQQALSQDYESYMTSIIWYEYAKELGPKHKDYLSYLYKSHRANIGFASAAVRLAQGLIADRDFDKAERVLEETWMENPTYQIGQMYVDMAHKPIEQAQRAKKLLQLQENDKIALVVVIFYYLKAQLWGEAKRTFEHLRDHGLTKHNVSEWELDYLRAIIEHDEKKDPEKAYAIMKQGFEYHLKHKWLCQYCGHKSLSWQPFCEECDAFDHIEYGTPKNVRIKLPILPY